MFSTDHKPGKPEHAKSSITYAYLLSKYGLTISWQDASAELGVYWENIRKMCQRGDIKAEKVGKSWVLTTKALADFIDHGSLSRQHLAQAPKQAKRNNRKYVSL